jgi:hypothetical protein
MIQISLNTVQCICTVKKHFIFVKHEMKNNINFVKNELKNKLNLWIQSF